MLGPDGASLAGCKVRSVGVLEYYTQLTQALAGPPRFGVLLVHSRGRTGHPLGIVLRGQAELSLVSCKASGATQAAAPRQKAQAGTPPTPQRWDRGHHWVPAKAMPQGQGTRCSPDCSLTLLSWPRPFPTQERSTIQTLALDLIFSALRQPKSELSLLAGAFGWSQVTYCGPCLCSCTQTHRDRAHSNRVHPQGHSTPGPHSHAQARVHMARARSRAHGHTGIQAWPSAHTRTCSY